MLNVLIILAIIFLVVVLLPVLVPAVVAVLAAVLIVAAFLIDLITYPFRVAYKLIKEAKRNR